MNTYMTDDQRRACKRYIDAWNLCNYFGTIISVADRINDVPNYLTKLGVDYLGDFLYINHKTQAFVYTAYLAEVRSLDVDVPEFNYAFGTLYLEKKCTIQIVEIYYHLQTQEIEWRKQGAQFTLLLDDDLRYGFEDDNVVVTEFTVPFGKTALEEVMLIY